MASVRRDTVGNPDWRRSPRAVQDAATSVGRRRGACAVDASSSKVGPHPSAREVHDSSAPASALDVLRMPGVTADRVADLVPDFKRLHPIIRDRIAVESQSPLILSSIRKLNVVRSPIPAHRRTTRSARSHVVRGRTLHHPADARLRQLPLPQLRGSRPTNPGSAGDARRGEADRGRGPVGGRAAGTPVEAAPATGRALTDASLLHCRATDLRTGRGEARSLGDRGPTSDFDGFDRCGLGGLRRSYMYTRRSPWGCGRVPGGFSP